ncbi:unnamed protein product [Lampetra fluviatilis]
MKVSAAWEVGKGVDSLPPSLAPPPSPRCRNRALPVGQLPRGLRAALKRPRTPRAAAGAPLCPDPADLHPPRASRPRPRHACSSPARPLAPDKFAIPNRWRNEQRAERAGATDEISHNISGYSHNHNISHSAHSHNISGYSNNHSGYSNNDSAHSHLSGYNNNHSAHNHNLSGYSNNLSGYSNNHSAHNHNHSAHNHRG